jgi:hypothetical protein
MNKAKIRIGITLLLLLAVTNVLAAHPINDYYKAHKNDHKMEAKIVPPKVAAKMVDEDYPEAIEMLKAMTTLRYLNYWGDLNKIKQYANQALKAKGNYPLLLEKTEGKRSISVFGEKKNGYIRKLFAVVQTKTQFILMIGRGKLTQKQLNWLPSMSKEIQ